MKPELYWLALTATMTGLFWIPYILNRALRSGVPGAFLTPAMGAPPVEAEWALRAKRAHANGVENLVVFSALILVAQLAGVSNSTTLPGPSVNHTPREVSATLATTTPGNLRAHRSGALPNHAKRT